MEKKKIKVIISMEGGVIQSVLANTEDIEVLTIDCDDDDFHPGLQHRHDPVHPGYFAVDRVSGAPVPVQGPHQDRI